MVKLSVAEIRQIAWFDQTIREKVAIELLASWPIPEQGKNGVGFWFFYYASFGPPPAKEFKLYPPCWRVWISQDDGAISQLERIEPKHVGLDVKERQPFATHAWPRDWTLEVADRKRAELLEAYETVLPLWQKRKGEQADLPEVADFRKRFLELTEPPLIPCYRALGKNFFAWLGV
jgi:hypothetical protein